MEHLLNLFYELVINSFTICSILKRYFGWTKPKSTRIVDLKHNFITMKSEKLLKITITPPTNIPTKELKTYIKHEVRMCNKNLIDTSYYYITYI